MSLCWSNSINVVVKTSNRRFTWMLCCNREYGCKVQKLVLWTSVPAHPQERISGLGIGW